MLQRRNTLELQSSRRTSPGSLAILAAMRRASSRVRSFAPRGVRATVSARALNVAAFNSQVGFGHHDGTRPQNSVICWTNSRSMTSGPRCLGWVRHADGTLVQPWRPPRRAIRVEVGFAVPFQHVRDACGVPAADCIRPFRVRADQYFRPCAPACTGPCCAPAHRGGADAGDNASRPVPRSIPTSCRSGRDGRQPIDACARGRPACAGCDVADRATTCNERGSPRR